MAERGDEGRSHRRRSWPLLAVLTAIVLLLVLVTLVSIDVLSAVRAYVSGESLYSKGQKDAQIHLIEYAEYRREEDYQRFLRALAAPLSYRVVREELVRDKPDVERARQGYLGGGTHPSEVPGVIRLFRWFHDTPLMAGAISMWAEGDRMIEEMRALAAVAHAKAAAGTLDEAEVRLFRERATDLNRRLTVTETQFEAELSESARQVQRLLLLVNVTLALLLAVTGALFVRYTQRVQLATENEVRIRQESLQRLLDSAAEGLFGVDTKGRCTFINRAALRMLRYEREEQLLERPIHALIHAQPDAQVAEAPPVWGTGVEQHVAEDRFRRQDGALLSVEYWSHPMFKAGRLEGSVITFVDIGERLELQSALREGELRMARLVDTVNDGVVTIDSTGQLVQLNRAAERLFGLSANAAIGQPVDRLVPGLREVGSSLGSDSGAEPLPERHTVYELRGRRSDGSVVPIEASLSQLQTDQGLLTTAIFRDVTVLEMARKERRARESLEAASRAKSDFMSRMSHELRTPLNAVLGFSQLLKLDAQRPLSADQLVRVQHIENAGTHLLALVNDILDLSRVESDRLLLRSETVELADVAGDAVAMITPLASATGVTVLTQAAGRSDEAARVLADRLRLRQILVNLLSNAIKYNRSGGTVSVRWQLERGKWLVSVVDDGPGISSDRVARLFEPFNRLGAEHSNIEGTGIGLVLSRRLAELMGGSLDILSTVGRGTTAVLTLTRSDEHAEMRRQNGVPSAHGKLDQPLRILYAEDNEVNVELVRGIVALRPSVELVVASNGASALDKALTTSPDLILVDMNLGDMSGLEVAGRLRANPSTSILPMIALSADALPEQIRAALAVGFDDYLTKPINFRALLAILDKQIESLGA